MTPERKPNWVSVGTEEERSLLLAVASVVAKLADEFGWVAESQEIRDLINQVETQGRNQ